SSRRAGCGSAARRPDPPLANGLPALQNGAATEEAMSVTSLAAERRPNLPHYAERVDLACAFRWTARLNMHEAVANHFSLAVDDTGTRFLMNPNQVHFSRIRASD